MQRASGEADRALAVAAVQQQADKVGSLRKLFDQLSRRDNTGGSVAEPDAAAEAGEAQ